MKKLLSIILLLISFVATAASYDVDEVRVYKTAHRMEMLFQGKIVKKYTVMLGRGGLAPKRQEGDNLVPEGKYFLDYKNPYSKFYRSIHISYPNAEDIERAKKMGVKPGFDIFVHGMPNLLTDYDPTPDGDKVNELLGLKDWTAGCIAVTNAEMAEIFQNIEVPIPITIFH